MLWRWVLHVVKVLRKPAAQEQVVAKQTKQLQDEIRRVVQLQRELGWLRGEDDQAGAGPPP